MFISDIEEEGVFGENVNEKKHFSRSWFRASSMIILNKNQPDAH
jgi:hypothetical protein